MAVNARLDQHRAPFIENHDLHEALKGCAVELKGLTTQKRNYVLRIAILAIAAFAITAMVFQNQGISFSELPDRLKALFQQPVGWQTGVILGSVSLAVGGALFIIYRVTRGKGKFWGDSHYRPVVLKQAHTPGKGLVHWVGRMPPHQQLVDTSLVKDGTGTTNAVQRKEDDCDISVSALLIAPIQTACAVAYNVMRFCLVPFYVAGRMIQEKITGKPAYNKQRHFELRDIPRQMGLSLYWALRAPFYGIAYFFSALYSLVDPMGGRKLGQLITDEWMEGIDRLESVWVCYSIDGHKFEGGGGAEKLGHQAYYWTGCWMPWATVTMVNGTITRACYPGGIFEYDIYYPKEADRSVPDVCEEPESVSIDDPIVSAKRLPPGHYRYVTTYSGQLYLTAHMTQRNGQRVYIARPVNEKCKDIDSALRESPVDAEGARVVPLIARERNVTLKPEDVLESTQPQEEGHYRYVRQGNQLYRVGSSGLVSHVNVQTLVTNELPQCKSRDLVYALKVGEWRKVSVKEALYIIAHKQNEWGDHLFIVKKVLDGDKTVDINVYLNKSLQADDKSSLSVAIRDDLQQ